MSEFEPGLSSELRLRPAPIPTSGATVETGTRARSTRPQRTDERWLGSLPLPDRVDDSPQVTVGALVVDPTLLLAVRHSEHAEGYESAQLRACCALGDHFARWFGLEEPGLRAGEDPEREPEPARAAEKQAAEFVGVQDRSLDVVSTFKIVDS